MKTVPFTTKGMTMSFASSAMYIGSEMGDELRDAIWDVIRTDVNVTIGGVTMFAAAWEDPEHWADDWAEELEIERDEAPDAVAAIIDAAMENS